MEQRRKGVAPRGGVVLPAREHVLVQVPQILGELTRDEDGTTT
ncbi:hypothetical protein [Streptomyces sp. NBC_00989]|nr:hypothetical protein OG714_20285 [Streptomyces sp. NBC_00989]